MTTSSILNEEQLTAVEPREDQMFERKGFDRPNIRYELSNINELSRGNRYVRTDEKVYVDPDTPLPSGPTSIGEAGTGGVEFVEVDGQQWETVRWIHGFSLLDEDQQVSSDYVADKRDTIMELFDFKADAAWLTGYETSDGSQRPGVFQWLKNAIPANRTFDASQFGGSVPTNMITSEMYGHRDGKLMSDSWAYMIGRPEALGQFSGRPSKDADWTYFDRIDASQNPVGVQEMFTVPPDISLPAPQGANEEIKVDLTSELGQDEVILLPPNTSDNFWSLYEYPEPIHRDPIRQQGGQEVHEYIWRFLNAFNPDGNMADAPDAMILKNVANLF